MMMMLWALGFSAAVVYVRRARLCMCTEHAGRLFEHLSIFNTRLNCLELHNYFSIYIEMAGRNARETHNDLRLSLQSHG